MYRPYRAVQVEIANLSNSAEWYRARSAIPNGTARSGPPTDRYTDRSILLIGVVSTSISTVAMLYRVVSAEREGRRGEIKEEHRDPVPLPFDNPDPLSLAKCHRRDVASSFVATTPRHRGTLQRRIAWELARAQALRASTRVKPGDRTRLKIWFGRICVSCGTIRVATKEAMRSGEYVGGNGLGPDNGRLISANLVNFENY
ncbi:hypothetical protein GW17_00043358 [Ensete ventricosum]|nr:hypothetical protein GW17_00043358 [Ensete ventricosum]